MGKMKNQIKKRELTKHPDVPVAKQRKVQSSFLVKQKWSRRSSEDYSPPIACSGGKLCFGSLVQCIIQPCNSLLRVALVEMNDRNSKDLGRVADVDFVSVMNSFEKKVRFQKKDCKV
ncbi:hypothetical protein TNCT_592521 [Trichonephila clavata]|uniref:Uncharacterized protein n=1 Tax=Trichonephila clavata TaxID=2740835 RepID=A0A8X6L6Z1_TRICU|nr:hypothetical protein TNCT_592521 [Trichonephila clavata]